MKKIVTEKNKGKEKIFKRIFLVAGARPNFMKIAPIMAEMRKYPDRIQPVFIHTGQHYDDQMSKVFLEELEVPEPDVYLGVGSGSHARQTAGVMAAFEKVALEEKPDLIVVVGDVNSTLACTLVAAKLWIPVAHVEAGLRSNDRTMPEEINRVVTDQLADILFTICRDADANLKHEGIPEEKIHFVGNVMIESLLNYQSKVDASSILEKLELKKGKYVLTTLHRPSNVDNKKMFTEIMDALNRIQQDILVVFPAHPRTQKQINTFGFENRNHRLILTPPFGYFDFLKLEKNACFVLTDSGGVQEETTFFGVPCLTIRENTERPITITEGTNILVGNKSEAIISESMNILGGKKKSGKIPQFWDDEVSRRIVEVIQKKRLPRISTEKHRKRE